MQVRPVPIPNAVHEALSRNAAQRRTVLDQAVRWKPANWRAKPLRAAAALVADRSSQGVGGELLIDRRGVLELTASVEDPLVSFVAAMIWGHGVRGYGPHRVENVIIDAGQSLLARLDGIATAARVDAAAAWDAFTATHKLIGLGPAFASKFAYFVAFAGGPPRVDLPPLIVDLNTSWAMWDLVQLARSVERREGYLDYVRMAVDWAGKDRRPDEVEFALFEIGKEVSRR